MRISDWSSDVCSSDLPGSSGRDPRAALGVESARHVIQIDEFDGGKVRHAFFTRRGGVSRGIYTSLNCGRGSGDVPADVEANRARTMAALDLPASALFTNHQVHSRSEEHPSELQSLMR